MLFLLQMTKATPTPRDVALWMVEQLEHHPSLCQEDAVYEIEQQFGAEFVYENENGNPAIDRQVLREFRRLTETSVVWEGGERLWRKRQSHDPPGRQSE